MEYNKHIYAELGDDNIYSNELEKCMLEYINSSNPWSESFKMILIDMIHNVVFHEQLTINANRLKNRLHELADHCALEIIDKKNKKELDKSHQLM